MRTSMMFDKGYLVYRQWQNARTPEPIATCPYALCAVGWGW